MHSPLKEVRLVNAEHEIQLHLIKEIRHALRGGQGAGELAQRLRTWNLAHCESEELLMQRHAYPEYEMHVAEHRQMAALLDAPMTEEAIDALGAYVRRHIRERDSHLHAYLDQFETGPE
jgi:hemerythrin